ncbi:M15 family metallopeptidase [Oceanimonas sp. CHS3-5]|uniref:M15 family metallopeptidase n=1 Tax=Oceanimonas sp. CHS3-5 TaxID=3068186 RepID=UPI00273D4E50|nr:M15 family metallopeptidase [Oceanimonas sp. CHS3-5]MDP5292551.1 M15 family metallopeptidase [Oceanimonas sp. CHS3-5]
MNFLSQPLQSLPEPDWGQLQALPIVDNGDPLVPLGLVPPPLRVYPAYFNLGVPGALTECYVRRSVVSRLQQAATMLPAGIELVVLDGWRPFRVQEYLFEALVDALKRRFPDEDEQALLVRARRFVAPPSLDETAPSPHLTGGAVDVCLCDGSGQLLNMGTDFDDISPWSYTAAFEAVAKPGPLEAEIIENRRLLHSCMTRAGFTNLPSEWWHYDFGNQSWAWYSKAPEAVFGVAQQHSLAERWRTQVAGFTG